MRNITWFTNDDIMNDQKTTYNYQSLNYMKGINDTLNEYICDDLLRGIIRLYIGKRIKSNQFLNLVNKKCYLYKLKDLIKSFKGLSKADLTWNTLCIQIQTSVKKIKELIVDFYQFVAKNKFGLNDYNGYVQQNTWILEATVGGVRLSKLYYKGSNPLNIYYIRFEEKLDVSYKTMFDLNTKSEFLRNILKEFIGTLSQKEMCMTRNKKFIFLFEKSLSGLNSLPNSLYDFNIGTFSVQYTFYKKINWDSHKATSILTRFYIFLLDYIEKNNVKHKVFLLKDGIDKYYLYRGNFDYLYVNGYRIVYYNRFDSIPETDKWLLAPNGEEVYTIAKKNYEYYPINFSLIKDDYLKKLVKKWYWESTISIYSKEKSLNCVFGFTKFLINIKRPKSNSDNIVSFHNDIIFNNNLNKFRRITVNDIVEYRIYLLNKYDNIITLNGNIVAIKSFLKYTYDTSLLDMDYGIFDYLKVDKKNILYDGHPILKEDLDLIVKYYKQNASTENYKDKLYWIIFNLCVTTNLRISEILNLKRNCLNETMKTGQFIVSYESLDCEKETMKDKVVLNLTRKGSHGVYKEENISQYTKRLVSEAIKVTSELAKYGDKEISEYLFLVKTTKNKVSVLSKDRFYRNFKRIVSRLDLKGGPYTVYNLRDTFMTNIFIQGKKTGKNVLDIHVATGHADLRTTIKHYRKSEIRDYLEAFYGVTIGDVDISGNIVEKISDVFSDEQGNHKESMVEEKSGFCRNCSCTQIKGISCLICNSFIVTLDRIPFLKNKIMTIDNAILKENIEHEKEHLIAIKKLCMAYLEQLYLLKARCK